MNIEDMKVGDTIWTILTTDEDDIPICALIKGTVTDVYFVDGSASFECEWEYDGKRMNWILFDADEVFAEASEAISYYLGWVSSQLTEDLIEIMKADKGEINAPRNTDNG